MKDSPDSVPERKVVVKRPSNEEWKKRVESIRGKTIGRRETALLVKEVSMIANDLANLLEEFEVEDNKKERPRLLQRSILMSVRGLSILVNEPFILNSTEYLDTMRSRLNGNEWAMREEIRHDSTTLTLFLAAEFRLLSDLGLSQAAIERFRSALGQAILEGQGEPEGLQGRIEELIFELTGELDRLFDDSRHKKLISRIAGVFEALGGALVIAGNTAAGALTAPVVPVTVIGAAISISAGTEVISRGVDRAKGS